MKDNEIIIAQLVDVIADGITDAYGSSYVWRSIAAGILKGIHAEKFAHDGRVEEAYREVGAPDGTGVPFERGTRPIAAARKVGAPTGEAPTVGEGGREQTPFEKFMTVAPGVTLVRFHGNDEIRLVARRKGSSGNPNTIFEIEVSKGERVARVYRDYRMLFRIEGESVGYSKVEAMAISALKSWFKDQRKINAQRRRKRKARLAAMNGGEQDGTVVEPVVGSGAFFTNSKTLREVAKAANEGRAGK